jgi:predicted acylesterase/phospholipase RssA
MARHIRKGARSPARATLYVQGGIHRCVFALAVILILASCSGLPRKPVPIDRMEDAELADIRGARAYWGKDISPQFQQDIIQSVRDEPADLFPKRTDGSSIYSGLAISGGGANGAFGAGVICGWTDAGTRPEFKLITGISTGSLIAPYVFAGKAYDAKLRAGYTTVSTKDIAKIKSLLPFGNESLADSSPLAARIARDVDETMLADIAAAHARGQRLYLGTTNLDAQRFVVWNMGAIAASGHPNALTLFRKVMLASASIPGAFPPVYIDVTVDGQTYDEMHVDGGVITQVFFYEYLLNMKEAAKMVGRTEMEFNRPQVYVIRNGKVNPEPQQISRKLLPIAERSLSTMIKSASLNDLIRIHQFAERDNIDFNYAGIPDDFIFESKEVFDPEEMNALFEIGYQMARKGKIWQKAPVDTR